MEGMVLFVAFAFVGGLIGLVRRFRRTEADIERGGQARQFLIPWVHESPEDTDRIEKLTLAAEIVGVCIGVVAILLVAVLLVLY
jgi:hypothetical protein